MDSKSNVSNETAQVFFFFMDEFLYNLAMEKLFLIMMKNLDVINKKSPVINAGSGKFTLSVSDDGEGNVTIISGG